MSINSSDRLNTTPIDRDIWGQLADELEALDRGSIWTLQGKASYLDIANRALSAFMNGSKTATENRKAKFDRIVTRVFQKIENVSLIERIWRMVLPSLYKQMDKQLSEMRLAIKHFDRMVQVGVISEKMTEEEIEAFHQASPLFFVDHIYERMNFFGHKAKEPHPLTVAEYEEINLEQIFSNEHSSEEEKKRIFKELKGAKAYLRIEHELEDRFYDFETMTYENFEKFRSAALASCGAFKCFKIFVTSEGVKDSNQEEFYGYYDWAKDLVEGCDLLLERAFKAMKKDQVYLVVQGDDGSKKKVVLNDIDFNTFRSIVCVKREGKEVFNLEMVRAYKKIHTLKKNQGPLFAYQKVEKLANLTTDKNDEGLKELYRLLVSKNVEIEEFGCFEDGLYKARPIADIPETEFIELAKSWLNIEKFTVKYPQEHLSLDELEKRGVLKRDETGAFRQEKGFVYAQNGFTPDFNFNFSRMRPYMHGPRQDKFTLEVRSTIRKDSKKRYLAGHSYLQLKTPSGETYSIGFSPKGESITEEGAYRLRPGFVSALDDFIFLPSESFNTSVALYQFPDAEAFRVLVDHLETYIDREEYGRVARPHCLYHLIYRNCAHFAFSIAEYARRTAKASFVRTDVKVSYCEAFGIYCQKKCAEIYAAILNSSNRDWNRYIGPDSRTYTLDSIWQGKYPTMIVPVETTYTA